MTHQWLISDPVLDDALNTALEYLNYTNATSQLDEIEEFCAIVITIAYQKGQRDTTRLSNCAVDAVESLLDKTDNYLPFSIR
jgi:hypothetical protein